MKSKKVTLRGKVPFLKVDEDTFAELSALANAKTDNLDQILSLSSADAASFEQFLTETGQIDNRQAQKMIEALKKREEQAKSIVTIESTSLEPSMAKQFTENIMRLGKRASVPVQSGGASPGIKTNIQLVIALGDAIAMGVFSTAVATLLARLLDHHRAMVTLDTRGGQLTASPKQSKQQIQTSVRDFLEASFNQLGEKRSERRSREIGITYKIVVKDKNKGQATLPS